MALSLNLLHTFIWKFGRFMLGSGGGLSKMRITFLFYCARSGSTHFATQMAKHSADTVVLPEFRFVQMLLHKTEEQCKALSPKQIKRLILSDMQFDNLGFSSVDIEDFCSAVAGKGRRSIVLSLLQRYRDMRDLVGSHFVIKNGQLVHQATLLAQLFPEASFVEIVRDPRAVVNSMMRTKTVYSYGGAMAGGDPLTAARLWLEYRVASDRLKAKLGKDYRRISYERFVSDKSLSRSVIEGICRKSVVGGGDISLPGKESSLHRLAQLPSDETRSGAWQSELPSKSGVAIEVLLGDSLMEAGYIPFFINGLSEAEIDQAVVTMERKSMRLRQMHYLRTIIHWARVSLVKPSQVVFRMGEASRSRRKRRS